MSGALPVAAAAYMAVCFVWLNATMGLARDMAGPDEGKLVSNSTLLVTAHSSVVAG